jgi:molybdenum cofactor cytidylyltransferase
MIPTNGHRLPTLRVVVFAAGFSSRLGQPKALVHVRGASLLRRTLRLLRRVASPARLIVVIPPRANRYRLGFDPRRVDFIVNASRQEGLASSVRAGIRRARCSAAVLLLPVDLVELDAVDVARLISRWRGARRRVVARRVGNHAGTPLILPRALYGRSQEVAGDQGLRQWVGLLPPDRVRLVNLASAQMDVDTPQDLERARRRLRPARAGHRSQSLTFCTRR